MSILNTHDIEERVEETVVSFGYVTAVEDYGEVGGNAWKALQEAIQRIGLNINTDSGHLTGWMGGRQVIQRQFGSQYNLDELTRAANDNLQQMGIQAAMVLEWFQEQHLDKSLIDNQVFIFIGKLWCEDGLTYKDFRLSYYRCNIERQEGFGLIHP